MKKVIWRKILFFLLAFGPLNPVYVIVLFGLGLYMFEILLGLGLATLYIFTILISCLKYYQAKRKLNRIVVLYAGWFILSVPIIFIGLNAIGGVSMAVVEGVAGTYLERLPQYLVLTLWLFLLEHILFVPWIFVVDIILQKVEKGQGK